MVYPTPQQVERSHSVFDPLHCVFLSISLRKFWHLPKPSSGTRVLFALHFLLVIYQSFHKPSILA